jgi:hypothetical protein
MLAIQRTSLLRIRRRRGLAGATGASIAIAGLLAGATAVQAAAPLTATNERFCEVTQYLLANTTQRSENVVHPDYEAFKKSKTRVNPLQTHQFVLYADAARTQPTRVSCKMKTVDHLVLQFGVAAAGPAQNSCRDLNHRIARNVFQSLDATEQARAVFPLARIRLEPDQTVIVGSKWVSDFQHVWQSGNELHLFSKALHVDFTDWLWRLAPEKFRGAYYCHLIAPEYLRRIVLGEVAAPSQAAD